MAKTEKTGKKNFVHARHRESAREEKQHAMIAKLEDFLHAYYDLLDTTGGPPDKYRPTQMVEEGIEEVEHLWWRSLDDDG